MKKSLFAAMKYQLPCRLSTNNLESNKAEGFGRHGLPLKIVESCTAVEGTLIRDCESLNIRKYVKSLRLAIFYSSFAPMFLLHAS
jgi:hypothetical protein